MGRERKELRENSVKRERVKKEGERRTREGERERKKGSTSGPRASYWPASVPT